MSTTTVALAITWWLSGQPMPPIFIVADLPFGEPTGQTGKACAAAEAAWRDMAFEELLNGPHNSMSMSFKCRERRGS